MLFARTHATTRHPILQALGTGIMDNKRHSSHALHMGSNIKPADVKFWIDGKVLVPNFSSICK
jgi:hypothetical protein